MPVSSYSPWLHWLFAVCLGVTWLLGCTPPLTGAASPGAASPGAASPGAVAVIVHPGQRDPPTSLEQIRSLFERRQRAWPNGAKVQPVDLPAESAHREVFSRAVFGRSTQEVERLWIRTGLQGGPRPPPALPPAKSLTAVIHTPGSIGYVPAQLLNGTEPVRVLVVIPAP